MERTTPLTEEHRSLGAKLAPFGGWLMPIQYAGIIAEHLWTRTHASVFDICHMGEFIIRGDAALGALERIVTFRLADLPVGACRYGFMLNELGGIIDDLIIYRLADAEWMAVVNAATTPGDAAHFRAHLPKDASFTDVSSSTAKLDLQGPESGAVLETLVGPGVGALGYYRFGHFDLLGEKVLISRTGYTGEFGYELYVPAKKAVELWKLLLADTRVKPAGLGARDTLRLEMGYPLYGQDLTTETTPFEADKAHFVGMDKEFLGKEALERAGRPKRQLIYFQAASRRAPRHNYRIIVEGRDAGVVTSGSFAPSLSRGIGMGYVDAGCPVGTAIVLRDGSTEIPATVSGHPFYKDGTARKAVVGS